MRIEVFSDDESTARAAAKFVAAEAATAVVTRGQFVIAVSGGRTPWIMLRASLGNEDVPQSRSLNSGGTDSPGSGCDFL